MAKRCKHFSKDGCEVYDNYGRFGCPINTTESCYVRSNMEVKTAHTNVIRARERAERIANSKICLELNDHQRKMLVDDILHVSMLCAFEAMQNVTEFINGERKHK